MSAEAVGLPYPKALKKSSKKPPWLRQQLLFLRTAYVNSAFFHLLQMFSFPAKAPRTLTALHGAVYNKKAFKKLLR
jgi:hypothetical protein